MKSDTYDEIRSEHKVHCETCELLLSLSELSASVFQSQLQAEKERVEAYREIAWKLTSGNSVELEHEVKRILAEKKK